MTSRKDRWDKNVLRCRRNECSDWADVTSLWCNKMRCGVIDITGAVRNDWRQRRDVWLALAVLVTLRKELERKEGSALVSVTERICSTSVPVSTGMGTLFAGLNWIHTTLIFYQTPRLTQPGHPSRVGDEGLLICLILVQIFEQNCSSANWDHFVSSGPKNGPCLTVCNSCMRWHGKAIRILFCAVYYPE